ncbi:hypothetical protein KKC88_03465 [Patescibacteria group bacterium]|nr:hypothetical protein [Patescibacteria group bacterium]MBU1673569.1 hypothetical protein [Patescibacteria group bacterium]MBU1963647.1 hypothetical protein [Patescibacteria group bacterium]
MEKQQKCKCTNQWIFGILIGIAVSTAVCLIYFFMIAPEGDYLGFVARKAPQPPVNEQLVMSALPDKYGKLAMLLEEDGVGEPVVDESFQDQCTQDCINEGYLDFDSHLYQEPPNPMTNAFRQECSLYCDGLINYGRSLAEICNDTSWVNGVETPNDEVCTKVTVQGTCIEVCRDCNTGVETYGGC